MIERVIYRFACACGHTWQGRKFGGLNGEDLGRCAGCDAPITEAMEAAAEPLGVESDGPDPRAPELLAFGVNVERCTHRFVGVKITDGEAALRCTSCGEKVGEATIVPPSSPCARCGGSHPLVEHYGTGVCPVLAPKAAALDAEITARVLGLEVADSREIDALRDLRALVLRHASLSPTEINRGRWAEVVKTARAAMTPATFDPAIAASWINLGRSITTTMATEEHECSHCHMVTHARVGMGPPATCPGCGR